MARSFHFRFAPSLLDKEIQHCPSISNNSCPNLEVISHEKVAGDKELLKICCENDPSLTTKNTNSNTFEFTEEKNVDNGLRQTCRYCHRKICGLKIDALRGDFLASFSDSLLNRVRRLERDLSLAESNLKNVKESRDNIAKRLRAYEAFVAEMLNSVDARGIVQITDEKGNEIVLQRVIKNNRSEVEKKRTNKLLETEIGELKSIIDKQQKTIEDLIEQRKFYVSRREQIKFVDRDIQTVSDNSHAMIERHIKIEPEEKNEKLPSTIEKPQNNENVNLVLNVQANKEETKICSEDKTVSSKCTTETQRVLKVPKPSGILVQGKNVKFAIVRIANPEINCRPWENTFSTLAPSINYSKNRNKK